MEKGPAIRAWFACSLEIDDQMLAIFSDLCRNLLLSRIVNWPIIDKSVLPIYMKMALPLPPPPRRGREGWG